MTIEQIKKGIELDGSMTLLKHVINKLEERKHTTCIISTSNNYPDSENYLDSLCKITINNITTLNKICDIVILDFTQELDKLQQELDNL